VRQGAGGEPQVVFLHTGISDKRSWEEVLGLLSPEMDMVAYDRRRFGSTTYRAEAHDQLVDLLAILDAWGWTGRSWSGTPVGARSHSTSP